MAGHHDGIACGGYGGDGYDGIDGGHGDGCDGVDYADDLIDCIDDESSAGSRDGHHYEVGALVGFVDGDCDYCVIGRVDGFDCNDETLT